MLHFVIVNLMYEGGKLQCLRFSQGLLVLIKKLVRKRNKIPISKCDIEKSNPKDSLMS